MKVRITLVFLSVILIGLGPKICPNAILKPEMVVFISLADCNDRNPSGKFPSLN